MLCPQEYLNKKIEIKESVKNHNFFSGNVVNKWTLKDYLIWTGDVFLRRIKTYYNDYQNSLTSLSKKQKMDRDLCEYVANLIKKKFSDIELKQLREELKEAPEGSVNIINSTVNNSNIISAQSNSNVLLTPPKRRRESLPSTSNTISIKKNKGSYSLIKPITPNVSFSLDSPCFDEETMAKVVGAARIKINDDCICEEQSLENEYRKNVEESRAKPCIKRLPVAFAFLSGALDQDIKKLLPWLGSNGFEDKLPEEKKKAILFIRLVLTDFYANCMKPPLKNKANERTPFIEYFVPVFKYYSAVYQDVNFQWCEKGLEGNRCLKYYDSEGKGKKRLADGIGYVVADNTESMLIESSGENNEEHKEEDTIKLLECSIRVLKMEMERMKSVSFATYKKRKFLSYLYANDKLTMLITSVIDKDHWGFVYVRDARIPRTWDTRLRWLKVFDLMLCTKDNLEEQQVLAGTLEKEEQGWVEVSPGESIDDMFNI